MFRRPSEGQSLISYLSEQDFGSCADLEKVRHSEGGTHGVWGLACGIGLMVFAATVLVRVRVLGVTELQESSVSTSGELFREQMPSFSPCSSLQRDSTLVT